MRRLALLLLLSSCALEEQVADSESPIIGGEPDDGDPAVVLFARWSPDLNTLNLCTAVQIGPDVLLTAAHCVDPSMHGGWGMGVFIGPDASAYPNASTLIPQLLPVASTEIHPDYDRDPPFTADLGIVVLEAPLASKPLPIQWTAPGPELEGSPARIIGYGQIVYDEYNARKHAADTVVQAIDSGDTLTVGDADHKSCVGDSGGPATVEVDGVETVVGINSYSDLTGCLEPAHYRRTDLYTDFIGQFIEPPSPPEEGGASGEGGAGGEASTAGGGPTSPTGDDDDAEDDGCSASGRSGSPTHRSGWLVGLCAVLFAGGRVASRRNARPTDPRDQGLQARRRRSQRQG